MVKFSFVLKINIFQKFLSCLCGLVVSKIHLPTLTKALNLTQRETIRSLTLSVNNEVCISILRQKSNIVSVVTLTLTQNTGK